MITCISSFDFNLCKSLISRSKKTLYITNNHDNHARETPINAAEDVAFGLYRTGTEQLSTESVNHVRPYVVNVQLGRAQINFKMEVDTGASCSTVFALLSQNRAVPDTFSVIDLASAFNQLFLDEESFHEF